MSIIKRRMQVEDIEAILEIEAACFTTPWSKAAFIQEINTNQLARYFVLEEAGTLVAYGGIWIIGDEGHITNIAVHPAFRKKGLGYGLVEFMIHRCQEEGVRAFTLEVRRSNASAIHLYEKHGFVEMGVRKGYYSDTKEDALIMWRQ